MTGIREQLSAARLLPILTVHSDQQAVDLCRALQEGGVNTVEITLRTREALSAIEAVRQTLPDLKVAVGTVISTEQIEALAPLDVSFAVSPGLTRNLSDCARQSGLAFLPGVSTASDILLGLELGHDTFKFFPAESSGGVAALKALSAPFTDVAFCPTGGVGHRNLRDYFSVPGVVCVGGSWMMDTALVARQDWRMLGGEVARMMAIAREMRP